MALYNISNNTLHEITASFFSILDSEILGRRLRTIISIVDEVIHAAGDIDSLSSNDISIYNVSFNKLKIDNRTLLGYRFGDIKYLTALKHNPEALPGDRPEYRKGCLWYTPEGWCIVPHGEDEGIIIDLKKASGNDQIFCSAPNAHDVQDIKQYWLQRGGKEYIPISEIKCGEIAFNEDWKISQVDIFSLTAFSVLAKIYSEAAEMSISHVDWINYRLCALMSDIRNNTETYGEYETLYNFLSRILYVQDLTCMTRLTGTGSGFTFEEYVMSAPPMDRMLMEMLYKHIDASLKQQKNINAGSDVSKWDWKRLRNLNDKQHENEEKNLAIEIKHMLMLKDSLTDFCSINASGAKEEMIQILKKKIATFFDILQDKNNYALIEKLFAGAAEIRKTPNFAALSKDKCEYYKSLSSRVPVSLNKWLNEHADMGAIMDSVSADKKYVELKYELENRL